MNGIRAAVLIVVAIVAPVAFGQELPQPSGQHDALADQIYRDESHCLTGPEVRDDKDNQISCYCRDSIMEARYVYFTYLLSSKDENLNGVMLVLVTNAQQTCGEHSDANFVTITSDKWKWRGPEVVRTYPPDDVVERITPEMKNGKPSGRWVPFTVQLVYRDQQGHVLRTENYATREFDAIFPKLK